ncbi:glycosyltransferase [Bacteroides intestinalis]|jgi:glycosyltransferase involved in cell wall biosynthesis|uniref:glycosyltransferase n=1 Tax=Bacteroides intestinalis TaxID=329854 RepID=UPI0022E7C9D3|nr:glycosyltransferase [Bacteroides intestinalis]
MSGVIKVGILLPVYKGDIFAFLKCAINSLLSQTYSNISIFIGIDGPVREDVLTFIDEFSVKSDIRIVRFEENRGLAAVLNDLLDICLKEKIDYIARMDADDISVDNRIQKQLDFLISHPEVDVVGGRIEEINEQSERNGKSVTYPLTHQECFKFFRYRDPLAHPAVMFRKSFFDKAKGYRNEYRKNQDTMLWFDGFMNGCIFANLDETVLLFRVTDDFYKNRRNGFKRAKKMLKDRFMINKSLHYDWSAYLFSFLMFIMTLTPPFLKKFLYRIR